MCVCVWVCVCVCAPKWSVFAVEQQALNFFLVGFFIISLKAQTVICSGFGTGQVPLFFLHWSDKKLMT